jgi:hypothetical protein
MTTTRAVWIGTCVFWCWVIALAAIMLAPITLGLSLTLLLPAVGAGALAWAPIGAVKPPPRPTYPPYYGQR